MDVEFATSSRQVPTDFKFSVINYSGGLERVPVAHTCFSTVDVPNYRTEADLKKGLEKALEHSRKMHPLGRIGHPDDIASAIAWLLSEENDWTTGQVIGIDGGLGRTRAGSS